MNATYIVAALAILAIIFVVARRHRHTNLDSLLCELKKFEQEQMLHLAKDWTETSERIDADRAQMMKLIGGPRGFLNMRKNSAIVLRMLEFFPEPIDGDRSDAQLRTLAKEIRDLAVKIQISAIIAMFEAIAVRVLPVVPFHGMKTISEYQKMIDTFYQLVWMTQPRMVERLEFVL